MSTCADAKTQPVTKEYEDGYDRIFGRKEPERGRWVQHPKTGKLIPAHEYDATETERAVDAPIMVDRFYEGMRVLGTGEDIGSRQRHREYMRRKGVTTADDYTQEWAKAAKEREARQRGEFTDRRERRDQIGRLLYEAEKKGRR